MIAVQSIALLKDAYRELNARKLFWITMALNLLVVGVFAALGLTENGVAFLHWEFDNPVMNSRMFAPELFYKLYFTSAGIPWWLSWIATILALVSTAGMFPDLVSGGVIETMLSKPISRTRLFLTKYVAGLLFVGLQVSVFSFGVLLVILIRGGAFEPSVLLAIPIVLVFFSYLFSICALLGLVTRSTIAALLLTLLIWFSLFLVNAANGTMIAFREAAAVRLIRAEENIENQIVFADARLEQLERAGTPPTDESGTPLTDLDAKRHAANGALAESQSRLDRAKQAVETWTKWSGRVDFVRAVLPKTDETVALLSRYTISEAEVNELMAHRMGGPAMSEEDDPMGISDPLVEQRITEATRTRSLWWVLGTSLIFEGVMLGLCLLIFSRRDF